MLKGTKDDETYKINSIVLVVFIGVKMLGYYKKKNVNPNNIFTMIKKFTLQTT